MFTAQTYTINGCDNFSGTLCIQQSFSKLFLHKLFLLKINLTGIYGLIYLHPTTSIASISEFEPFQLLTIVQINNFFSTSHDQAYFVQIDTIK